MTAPDRICRKEEKPLPAGERPYMELATARRHPRCRLSWPAHRTLTGNEPLPPDNQPIAGLRRMLTPHEDTWSIICIESMRRAPRLESFEAALQLIW